MSHSHVGGNTRRVVSGELDLVYVTIGFLKIFFKNYIYVSPQ